MLAHPLADFRDPPNDLYPNAGVRYSQRLKQKHMIVVGGNPLDSVSMANEAETSMSSYLVSVLDRWKSSLGRWIFAKYTSTKSCV